MAPNLVRFALLLTLIILPVCLATKRPLGDFISHHEDVDYDLRRLDREHKRISRSTATRKGMSLQFTALGRDFNLHLSPDPTIYHNDLVVTTSTVSMDTEPIRSSTYSGTDINDPGSVVKGNVLSGVFDGIIYSSDKGDSKDTFYIEPAHRYSKETSTTAHSIIYRHSDINGEALNGAKCGVGMTSLSDHFKHTKHSRSVKSEDVMGEGVMGEGVMGEGVRRKRADATENTRCSLSVTGDYLFYKEVTKSITAGEEVKINVAISLLTSIIQGASDIFQGTEFPFVSNAGSEPIQFGLNAITIESEKPAMGNPFAPEFIGVEKYLDLHSDESAKSDDRFCLTYRFTYRDFEGGVLGLAYVAQKGAAGGVCQEKLNTGIVTLLNYERRVPTAVTTLTMAHEAGHNFGSEHDQIGSAKCDPSDGGKFIMYAFANDGSQGNNDDFSPCSTEMMDGIISDRANVMFYVDEPNRENERCFENANDFCRNGLLDDGEECDCGRDNNETTGMCNTDRCCKGSDCTLSVGASCSPSQGVCCNPMTCERYTVGDNEVCAMATDCSMETICNGSLACPPSVAVQPSGNDSFVLCNNGTGTCNMTECTGSFCQVIGADSCECPDEEQICHVCCMIDGKCTSTFDIAKDDADLAMSLPDGEGLLLPIGHACNDFRGYCDHLENCFVVDNEGALNRLADLFSGDQLNAAVDWIKDHWWAVLSAAVGLFIGLFFIILIIHLLLPRPEHVKKRAERRKTIRRSRRQGVHPDPQRSSHEMRITN